MKRPLLILTAISLLWGSEWLLDQWVNGIPRFRLLAIRSLVAAFVLVPVTFRPGKPSNHIPIYKSVLLGVVVNIVPILFLANCTDLSPGLVVVLFAILPLMTSVIEEGRGLASAPILIGGLGGTAFLVRGGLSFSLSQTVPVLILLLILIAVAAVLVRAKQWMSITNIPAAVMIQMFTAAAVFGSYSFLREGTPVSRLALSTGLATLALGILASALAHCGFYWLLANTDPSQAAAVQWLVPVVGLIESAILLRHLPPWDSLLGGIVSVSSAILMFRSPIQGDSPLTLKITNSPQQ
jgi:drug/metabolite transporter (DMT)-like permease